MIGTDARVIPQTDRRWTNVDGQRRSTGPYAVLRDEQQLLLTVSWPCSLTIALNVDVSSVPCTHQNKRFQTVSRNSLLLTKVAYSRILLLLLHNEQIETSMQHVARMAFQQKYHCMPPAQKQHPAAEEEAMNIEEANKYSSRAHQRG